MQPHDLSESIFDLLFESLPISCVQKLVDFHVDKAIQARIDELADKCTEGELSPPERNEYERFVHTGDLMSIVQAHARAYLRRMEKGGGRLL